MKYKKYRILVKKSNRYIYAQIIDDSIGNTILSVNSFGSKNKSKKQQTIDSAKELASKIKSKQLTNLFYSTGTALYRGRIKIFANILRENGINF